MFKSSKAYCNGELIWDAKDPKFNHCLKKDIEHYKKYLKEKENFIAKKS
jgi:hypothetical protein